MAKDRVDAMDPTAKTRYYTIRDDGNEAPRQRLFAPDNAMPDAVPVDWYAARLRESL